MIRNYCNLYVTISGLTVTEPVVFYIIRQQTLSGVLHSLLAVFVVENSVDIINWKDHMRHDSCVESHKHRVNEESQILTPTINFKNLKISPWNFAVLYGPIYQIWLS